jgi:hypothetical protein
LLPSYCSFAQKRNFSFNVDVFFWYMHVKTRLGARLRKKHRTPSELTGFEWFCEIPSENLVFLKQKRRLTGFRKITRIWSESAHFEGIWSQD